MTNVRYLGVQCLIRIEEKGYSNLVLKEVIDKNSLSGGDVSFLTSLIYTTLERKITLEYILSQYTLVPINRLDIEVRNILLVGLAQILFMDSIPSFAAINEAVKLAKSFKKSSSAGLVNAVLRKASSFNLLSLEDIPDEEERLSIIYSVNRPLVSLIMSQYSNYEEILKGMFTKRVTTVRVNSLKTTVSDILKQLQQDGLDPSLEELPFCLSLSRHPLQGYIPIEEGIIRIQSYCSQAVVHALGLKKETTLIDLCSAPGGKTLTAAQEMGNTGRIIAFDRHENRLKLLKERAKVEEITAIDTVETKDSTIFDSSLESIADYVIADVPCSGYGQIHTKPELREKKPEDFLSLYDTQLKILTNGAKYLKVGGKIVYSTCTINKKENEDIVERFLKENEGYEVVKDISINGFSNINGYMIKLPSVTDGEGFFFVCLERRTL